MNRKRKKKGKPLPKDYERAEFGPLLLERSGRFMRMKNRRTPTQHKAFLANLKDSRKSFLEEFERARDELIEVLQTFLPLPLLAESFFTNCLMDPETYEEPSYKGIEAYPEYLLSLIAALGNVTGGQAPGEAEGKRVANLLDAIFQSAMWYWGTEDVGESPDALSELRVLAMTRRLMMRGSSYPAHHRDLVRAIFDPHEELLRARLGFGAADLLAAEAELMRQFHEGMAATVLFRNSAEALRDMFLEFLDTDTAEDAESLDELRDEFRRLPSVAEGTERLASLTKEGALDPFHIRESPLLPRSLLERLSFVPGEGAAFLEPPINGSPINAGICHRKPFLRLDDSFFAFVPSMLFRNFSRILEEGVRGQDGRLEPAFRMARHTALVSLARTYLQSLLPGAISWESLYYAVGTPTQGEIDLLVAFDEILLIVEAKGRTFSEAAERGGLKALETEINRLLEEPFQQVSEAERYLRSAEEVVLQDAQGKEVVRLRRRDWRKVVRICVTLSDASLLTAQLGRIHKIHDLAANELPWAIFVNDLRVISEILDSPSQFVLFLDRRLRANTYPQLHTLDELDYLMLFLYEGLYPTREHIGEFHTYHLAGYTVDLDSYYMRRTAPKPALRAVPGMLIIVGALEQTNATGRTEVGAFLLGLDKKAQQNFIAILAELNSRFQGDSKAHNAYFTFLENNVGIGLVVDASTVAWRSSELRSRHALRMYQHRLGVWYSLIVTNAVGDLEVGFEIVRQAWEKNDEMEARLGELRRNTLAAVQKLGQRPGRNDLCPCGSGSKFKKCCGSA